MSGVIPEDLTRAVQIARNMDHAARELRDQYFPNGCRVAVLLSSRQSNPSWGTVCYSALDPGHIRVRIGPKASRPHDYFVRDVPLGMVLDVREPSPIDTLRRDAEKESHEPR